MNQREYEEEVAALTREVPELIEEIRAYIEQSLIEGRPDVAERFGPAMELLEEMLAEFLDPFAPRFSDN